MPKYVVIEKDDTIKLFIPEDLLFPEFSVDIDVIAKHIEAGHSTISFEERLGYYQKALTLLEKYQNQNELVDIIIPLFDHVNEKLTALFISHASKSAQQGSQNEKLKLHFYKQACEFYIYALSYVKGKRLLDIKYRLVITALDVFSLITSERQIDIPSLQKYLGIAKKNLVIENKAFNHIMGEIIRCDVRMMSFSKPIDTTKVIAKLELAKKYYQENIDKEICLDSIKKGSREAINRCNVAIVTAYITLFNETSNPEHLYKAKEYRKVLRTDELYPKLDDSIAKASLNLSKKKYDPAVPTSNQQILADLEKIKIIFSSIVISETIQQTSEEKCFEFSLISSSGISTRFKDIAFPVLNYEDIFLRLRDFREIKCHLLKNKVIVKILDDLSKEFCEKLDAVIREQVYRYAHELMTEYDTLNQKTLNAKTDIESLMNEAKALLSSYNVLLEALNYESLTDRDLRFKKIFINACDELRDDISRITFPDLTSALNAVRYEKKDAVSRLQKEYNSVNIFLKNAFDIKNHLKNLIDKVKRSHENLARNVDLALMIETSQISIKITNALGPTFFDNTHPAIPVASESQTKQFTLKRE